ncbi:MAG TPA: hypothetical protein VIR55_07435 [Ignavibacteria bacterium]
MEYYRRWILLFCIITGVWFFFFTYITSYYQVSLFNAENEQKKSKEKLFFKTESSYIYDLPINDYIKEITRNKIYKKDSPEWINFFGELKDDKFKENRGEFGNSYYFSDSDPLLNQIKDKFNTNTKEIYIQIPKDTTLLIKVKYEIASYNDFQFYTFPKIKIFYPLRKYSYFVLLLGLLLFIFLPYKKHGQNEFYYDRWRILLGDFIAYLLFFMFFVIPFIVLNSSQLIFLNPLSYLFFLPLIPAIYLIFMQMKMASFSIYILDDKFVVSTYKGDLSYDYSDIESYNELEINPPKWLKTLSAISYRSRLLITEYSSLKINFKNNRFIIFSGFGYSNQKVAKGFESVLSILEKFNIKKANPEIISKFGFIIGSYDSEIKNLIKNKIIKKKVFGKILLLTMLLLFIIGIVEFYIHLVPEKLPKEKTEINYGTSKLDILLERTFNGSDHIKEGIKIFTDKFENSFIIAEERYFDFSEIRTNIILLKIDKSGNKIKELNLAKENLSEKLNYTTFEQNSILFLGLLGDEIFFFKIDTSLNIKLEKSYKVQDLKCTGFDIKLLTNGYELLLIGENTNNSKYLVRITTDKDGNKINQQIKKIKYYNSVIIKTIKKVSGGFIIGGILRDKNRFDDIYIVRYNDNGDIVHSNVIGSNRPEKINDFYETKDGNIIIAGSTKSFSETEDFYVVCMNKTGNILWEKNYGNINNEECIKVNILKENRILLTGISQAPNSSYHNSYIVVIDNQGNKLLDTYVGDFYNSEENKNLTSYTIYDVNILSNERLSFTGSKDKYYFSGIEKEILFLKAKF